MPPKTIVLDSLNVEQILLNRVPGDPVTAQITYTISAADGSFGHKDTFTPTIPGGIQSQLNNLWDLGVTAAMQREGLA